MESAKGTVQGVRRMMRHSTVTVNGANLHVARTGQGRPLLLLHGWPEFWRTWEPIMTRLADRYDLIAPDLRGFGGSDKLTAPFGLAEQAADVTALIGALDVVAPVGIVSHDAGATVTQVLARRSPESIAGLFVFNFMYPGIGKRFVAPDHLAVVWHTFFNQSSVAAKLVGAWPEGVRLFVTHFLHEWTHREGAFDDATLDACVANFQVAGNLEGGAQHDRAVAGQRKKEYAEEGRRRPSPCLLAFAGRSTTRRSRSPGPTGCRSSSPISISRRSRGSATSPTTETRIGPRTRSPPSSAGSRSGAGALDARRRAPRANPQPLPRRPSRNGGPSMRVFITGVSGYLGGAIACRLVRDGAEPIRPPPRMEARVATGRLVLGVQGIRTAVLCNGMVYGDPVALAGESDMVAALARGAKAWGRARHVDRGLNRWANVQVEDMADLYTLARREAPAGRFLYVENGETEMRATVQAIADRFGLGEAETADLGEAEKVWGHRLANYTLGANSRVRGHLGRALGWRPQHGLITDWLRRPGSRLLRDG